MLDVQIVHPDPGEWEHIRALRIQSVTTDPAAFGQTPEEASQIPEEEWRKRLSEKKYLCAKIGDSYIGMVSVVPEKNQKSKHIANVYSVYVTPDHRRKGIGKLLLQSLINDVKQRLPDVAKLELYVAAPQEAAHDLYKSVGFKDVCILEKQIFLDGKYVDEYLMTMFIRDI